MRAFDEEFEAFKARVRKRAKERYEKALKEAEEVRRVFQMNWPCFCRYTELKKKLVTHFSDVVLCCNSLRVGVISIKCV